MSDPESLVRFMDILPLKVTSRHHHHYMLCALQS